MILPKLNIICGDKSASEAIQHVAIINGEVVAANHHILVVHDLKKLINDDKFISNLPERFYIFKEDWNKLTKKFIKLEFINNELIKIVRIKSDDYIYIVPGDKFVYPKYNNVFPTTNYSKIESIKLNAKLLYDLSRAIGSDKLKLSFYGKERGVLVESIASNSLKKALIMPLL